MRSFININGIDVTYSDVYEENGEECVTVKCSTYDIASNTVKTAECVLPRLEWIEHDDFHDFTIKYLTEILENVKEKIMYAAKTKADPTVKDEFKNNTDFLNEEQYSE